jgi:PKD repeat protein
MIRLPNYNSSKQKTKNNMKKQLLAMAALSVFGSATMLGQHNFVNSNGTYSKQTGTTTPQNFTRCATQLPGDDWDAAFNQLVAQYKADHTAANGKLMTVPATIPVVVHILHNQASITGENISAAQVASQITVLNADYAGTNSDIGSVPSIFTGVKANDCQVQFCLATIDPSGNTMANPGIDRINWNTQGWTDPNSFASSPSLQAYFDGTIKPATIWDPTKYMNIWVAKVNGSGLLGYASFPAGTGLTGLSGVETATTSGVVINCYAFGTTGIAGTSGYSMYNKGRTATHEVGHWLGLRHISGDAACGDDYCTDTPKQKGGFSGGGGGLNFGCPSYPYLASGECTGTNSATTAGSEMFMNYMDYVDDACMYMFSADQKTRIQTAMTNGTYRKFLGTHGLCSSTPAAPVAAFSIASTGCTGSAVTVTNNTSGNPTPTYSWTTAPSTGVTINTATSANPTITFTNTGTYTVSVTATNSQGSNSTNQVITINNCTLAACDTMANLADTNTITIYRIPAAQGGGYLSGNNGYGDTHKAEYFTQNGIAGANVTGMMVFFYANGTIGTGGNASSTLAFEMYNGTSAAGPTGTAVRSENVTLGTIATNGVPNGALLAYVHDFSTPAPIATNEFFVGIKLPTTTGDTAVVLSSLFNASNLGDNAWEKYNNAWEAMATTYGQTSLGLAIFPFVCPASVGLAASELNSKISVFPNPSNGVINLAYAMGSATDMKIEVTNMLGQVVYSSVENGANTGTKSIDLSGASKGVYLVTVSTGTDKMIRKVVID